MLKKLSTYSHNTACRVCGNQHLYKFLELGPQPPANAFLTEKQFSDEQYYPLDVYFCPRCGLVQLTDVVDPKVLFKDYAYFTGKSSKTMQLHFKKLATKLTKRYRLKPRDLVVDIGGNDGTFLKNFKCRTLNIDPATNVVEEAVKNGVDSICAFWDAKLALRVLNKYGKAKIITATNVFAHVNNLYDFMAGISLLLADDGTFVVEVPHFLNLYKNNEWDTIYHEHLSYFLLEPLLTISERFRLGLFKVEQLPVHGGSIRCYIGQIWSSLGWLPPSVAKLYDKEWKLKLYEPETYKTFANKVKKTKNELVTLLTKLKKSGKRIVGYGAPAKGNTLLNYCGIGNDILDYLTDTTPYKQGRYSPGTHIPVVSPEFFHEDSPDYALMLPWNYKKEILEKEKEFIKNGGKFIVPIPNPTIVP